MKQSAYIFDIDNTLADCSHRLHFLKEPAGLVHFEKGETDWKPDWDSFHAACVDDTPIKDVIDMLGLIHNRTLYQIIFVTGRPEKSRSDTANWLMYHTGIEATRANLFMRPDGDHREDKDLKREIYEQKIKDKYEIRGVFEDRQQCVDMWRSLGLTCFQVANGNY